METQVHTFNDVTDIIDSQIDVKYVLVLCDAWPFLFMLYDFYDVCCQHVFGSLIPLPLRTGQFGERKGTDNG